jgi:molecular chaperone DnaK
MEDLGSDVTAEEKEQVEKAEEALKAALEGTDLEEIKAKKADLEKAAQSIAVKAYEKIQKEQQAKEQNNNNQDNNSNDDNTVNADFEDID